MTQHALYTAAHGYWYLLARITLELEDAGEALDALLIWAARAAADTAAGTAVPVRETIRAALPGRRRPWLRKARWPDLTAASGTYAGTDTRTDIPYGSGRITDSGMSDARQFLSCTAAPARGRSPEPLGTPAAPAGCPGSWPLPSSPSPL
jgi:hypothetical protein